MTENASLAAQAVNTPNADEVAPIEQTLRCRLGHRIHDLRIWVEPHGLIMRGCTSSFYDKQMAQHLVREMSGLGVADNRIVVDSRLAEVSASQSDQFQTHRYGHGPAARHRPAHRHNFPR
jgi:hypothetical protein